MDPNYVRLNHGLARVFYQHIECNNKLQSIDKTKWYDIALEKLKPSLAAKFVSMHFDEETRKFLDTCFENSDNLCKFFLHFIVKSTIGWFISSTTYNGLLNRGTMFVMSSRQFQCILSEENPEWMKNESRVLLDLGAGDGNVTDELATMFTDVHVTEINGTMARKLQQKGYKVKNPESWSEFQAYDVISCLNVLDRCDAPWSLLHDVCYSLKPKTGRLLLALVLPFSQWVESKRSHDPDERLDHLVCGKEIETQLHSVVHNVFGDYLELVNFTRVPYLCEGDFTLAYHELTDIVMVLKTTDKPLPRCPPTKPPVCFCDDL